MAVVTNNFHSAVLEGTLIVIVVTQRATGFTAKANTTVPNISSKQAVNRILGSGEEVSGCGVLKKRT